MSLCRNRLSRHAARGVGARRTFAGGLAALVLAAATGCAADSVADLPPELQAASVVSSRGPGPGLGPSGQWSFMPDSRILASPDRDDAAWVESSVQNALITEMEARGWAPTSASGVELQLGYLIAVDDELTDAAIQETFGMTPGLPVGNNRYGKGTLVVELRRGGSPQALWRGSVQILADPTLSKPLRLERIRNGVASLMRRLPMGG